MSWELILFLAAAIHGILLSIAFLVGKQSLQKRFLGIYLLLFSITILYYVNFWSQAIDLPLVLIWLGNIGSWLMPFCFYYFINSKARQANLKFHFFIPIVFTLVFFSTHMFGASQDFQANVGHVLIFSNILLFIVYGIPIFKTHRSEEVNPLFLIPYAAFTLGLLAYKISLMVGFYTLRLDYIICGGFVILTYGITYFSEFSFLKDKVRPKYSTSSLTKEDGDHLVEKINEVLNQNKYYRDPNFNLSLFAEKIGVPKYRISQALNAFSDKSFTSLINEFRIMEAKEKLQNKASGHLKLEAIGEEVGFRNKVSFYNNFKKLVGTSPGEFRDEHMQKSA
ncbi:helix-turn-helix domain-containing protein [Ekhidna sp.]|uniref:AraC family transcriptional regulator n=1 Tax=Ekhidna sp. TaxID=2608089 RepID=UPI003C7C55FB